MTDRNLMGRRKRLMIFVLVIIFGGLIAANVIKKALMQYFLSSYKPPAVTVSSAKVREVNWKPTLQAVGNFVAINGVEVNSQASGNVVQIHFESGQLVEKNAPLITIDDSIDQALLKFNQSELTLKELNYKRQTDLFKRGATPSSSVDEAKANLQQAHAKVEQIQAQINQKHINAPFSGRLGIRKINLGQYISPGQTSIVSLQSLDPLYLEFYLPEQRYKEIHPNQTIRFHVEEFPQVVFEGTIVALNSKVDVNTHNVQIQALLPNCPSLSSYELKKSSFVKVKQDQSSNDIIVTCNSEANQKNKVTSYAFIPGMFASIEIEEEPIPHTLIVPATSISYSLYGNSIYVIKPNPQSTSKDNKDLIVERVFVTTGPQHGNDIVIEKGVKKGQLIVSAGDIKLQNGTSVVINNDVQLNEKVFPDSLGE